MKPLATSVGLAALLSAAAFAEWTAPIPHQPIGMNVQGASYWDRVPYLDPMLASGEWITYHDGGPWDDQILDSIRLRSDGWPLAIPQTVNGTRIRVKTMLNNCRAGDYTVIWDGAGKFSWNGGASSRTENGKLVVTMDGSCNHAWMTLDSSSAADPVRNLRMVPSEYAANPSSMPLFDPAFVRGLKPFRALRFMDWTSTNGSRQIKWADRPVPGYRTFGEGKGMPWEHAIALANQLGEDAWICAPHAADDDYLRKLAILFRDSMRPDLKTYLEYSNEIWNWGFDQAHWVGQNGMTVTWGTEEHTMLAADSLRDSLKRVGRRICGDTTNYCHPEKDAWMMGRLFRIWEPVFATQRNRLVTVATGQHAWTDNSRRILAWLVDSMRIVPDAFSVGGYVGYETSEGDPIPRSVIPRAHDSILNNYFHNQWMLNPESVKASDVTDALNAVFPYTSKLWTIETARIVRSFGIKKYLVYEGGQHAQPHEQQDWPYNQAVWDAQVAPGMRELYLRNFQLHDSIDCDLFMAFSYVSARESRYGSWGHLENYGQSALGLDELRVQAPKYAALLEVNGATSGTLHRSGSDLRRLRKVPVVNGRIPTVTGSVEVFDLGGRVLHRGTASSANALPTGVVLVRPVE